MIYCCPTTIFKWHTHLLSNFIDFSIFCACAHLFWVITTTWGCHPPPSTGHLSLHHLLALCHAHPTLPSPWVTPRLILAHARAYFVHYCNNQFPHSPDILPSGRLGLSM